MKKLAVLTICFISILFFIGLVVCQSPKQGSRSYINGINFVAPVRAVKQKALVPIKKVNANWVAITPYAFSEADKPEVNFNYTRQWWGERKEGVIKTITYAKNLGLKVMLKPHVWVHGPGNSWTGNFGLQTPQEWSRWGKNYANYIVNFAKIADSLDVDLLCVGTEYSKAVNTHPKIWRYIIKKVRAVYSGKLTYAANWDNYQKVSFWDALDYIGIDAYFPLSDKPNPDVSELQEHWEPIKIKLHRLSKRYRKPVLFTEYGYQSVNYATAGHWKYKRGQRAVNEHAQVYAYKALYKTFWHQPWFAGGFVWKWYHQLPRYHHHRKKGFTPQGKQAEHVLRNWYGRY